MSRLGAEIRSAIRKTSGWASVWRCITWYVRNWRVQLSFYMVAGGGGDRVLFIDSDSDVRRGVMFNNHEPDPYELYVYYIGYNHIAGRLEENGTFLRKADKHVRWTYGWGKREAQALLAAEALR